MAEAAATAEDPAGDDTSAVLAPVDVWLPILRLHSSWAKGTGLAAAIDPAFNHFHPHACHTCKRGAVTRTALRRCNRCALVS